MDPTGPTAQRFPLIARPRPPCTALPARIQTLTALADQATRDRDLTAASRVHNQAALIASDCGNPDLARAWCHGHARAYLTTARHDTTTARHALEPLINLARLHIRAGNGHPALALLQDLHQAVQTRTDTTIDGITVPAAAFTSNDDHHCELSQWLWSVLLADGSRALTTAGRWHDAEALLRRHHGIGRRMLDGRQVAVIARAVNSDHTRALQLLAETQPGEPWEAAVTACLTALTRPTGSRLPVEHLTALGSQYRNLPVDRTLTHFRTRLGLSIIDGIGDPGHPVAQRTAHDLIADALNTCDGYAARDLLAHPACLAASTLEQTQELATVLEQSNLGQQLPTTLIDILEAALASTESLIIRYVSANAA